MSQNAEFFHQKGSASHNWSFKILSIVTMEDRPFEPMLVAGNSQVNLWERLYVKSNSPASVFSNLHIGRANYSLDNHS